MYDVCVVCVGLQARRLHVVGMVALDIAGTGVTGFTLSRVRSSVHVGKYGAKV
jgi:hypothetical protein